MKGTSNDMLRNLMNLPSYKAWEKADKSSDIKETAKKILSFFHRTVPHI